MTIPSALFEKYAEIKERIKELEESAKETSERILSVMRDEDADKVELEVGTFTRARRRNWTFTDAVKELEKAVSIRKDSEKASGYATCTETEFLVLHTNGDKKDIA